MEIVREDISGAGLTGVYVSPAGDAATAAVVVLGGSEGGLHEHDARVLAEEGFAALALAYFGADGVPPVLKDIPLEYFTRAIDLLEAKGFRPGAIGLLGGSRGGEAALLVASRDERVGAVVSVVGSGVVTEGIDYSQGRLDRILRAPATPWIDGGRPLRYLPYVVGGGLADRIERGGVVDLRDAFPPVPKDPDALDAVSIPVERIRGAVLLLSAEDDRMWDSPGFSRVAEERLRAHQHPYPWDHVVFVGAGHPIAGPPGNPQTSTTAPGPGVTFEMGGTPERNSAARREAWDRSVTFLREHLSGRN